MLNVKGFGTPIRETDLKPGDLFVGDVGEARILALQTDMLIPGESEPMVCVLKASDRFRDQAAIPNLLFRSNVSEHVRLIENEPTVRPAEEDLPLIGNPEGSYLRGYLALGVDGSAFIRAGNGAGGYVWLNLGNGETAQSPKMPLYYRRWRITIGSDEKPLELVRFGNQ
jgi:hypothetical protein